jgi:DNA-binding NtrC family response regulator
MSLWTSGAASFTQAVQEISPEAMPLEDATVPAAGDHLILELEGEDRVSERSLARWVAQGCTVIVACAARRLAEATELVRRGARYILLTPIDADELRQCLAPRAVLRPERNEVRAWRERFAPEIVGESQALFEALEIAMRAAECDCPVLITGENGTGKELLARAFHRSSERARAPFVPVNCPAIPKELVESELFGHTRGAFTGATMARVGRFEAADRGTLLLDEIGEMALDIQAKLLRVLQDYQITRVGESRPHPVDVRIIAATNRDLEEMVQQGSFREDLYYRLNVLQVHLPPLRDRREDIPLLVDHFLAEITARLKMPAPELGAEVRSALAAHHWPGNVRQLHNVIERLVILRRGQRVELQHLPFRTQEREVSATAVVDAQGLLSMTLPSEGIDLREALQQLEDSMIRQALLQTAGNKNQAARILGLNRTTLVEKLRKRMPDAVNG